MPKVKTMPVVNLEIDKNGAISMDYEGYVGNECEMAEEKIRERIANLKLSTSGETRKGFEDRKLEIERQ